MDSEKHVFFYEKKKYIPSEVAKLLEWKFIYFYDRFTETRTTVK